MRETVQLIHALEFNDWQALLNYDRGMILEAYVDLHDTGMWPVVTACVELIALDVWEGYHKEVEGGVLASSQLVLACKANLETLDINSPTLEMLRNMTVADTIVMEDSYYPPVKRMIDYVGVGIICPYRANGEDALTAVKGWLSSLIESDWFLEIVDNWAIKVTETIEDE